MLARTTALIPAALLLCAACASKDEFASVKIFAQVDRSKFNESGKFLNGRSYEVGLYEVGLVAGNVIFFGSDVPGDMHAEGKKVRQIELKGFGAVNLVAKQAELLGEVGDDTSAVGGAYSDMHIAFGQSGKSYDVGNISRYPKLQGHTLHMSGLAEKGGKQYGFDVVADIGEGFDLREIAVSLRLSGGSTAQMLIGFDAAQWIYDVDFAPLADENDNVVINPQTAPDVTALIVERMKNNDFVRQIN